MSDETVMRTMMADAMASRRYGWPGFLVYTVRRKFQGWLLTTALRIFCRSLLFIAHHPHSSRERKRLLVTVLNVLHDLEVKERDEFPAVIDKIWAEVEDRARSELVKE